MKILKSVILLLSITFLISCSSDDNGATVTNDQFADIVVNLPNGTWEVSNFTNNQTDETPNFESFVFTFQADGSVVAVTDLFSEQGIWIYYDASSQSNNTEELDINFNMPAAEFFEELNEDWEIINATETQIDLTDEKNGEVKILTFTKIE